MIFSHCTELQGKTIKQMECHDSTIDMLFEDGTYSRILFRVTFDGQVSTDSVPFNPKNRMDMIDAHFIGLITDEELDEFRRQQASHEREEQVRRLSHAMRAAATTHGKEAVERAIADWSSAT
jgi:hypothetical protein